MCVAPRLKLALALKSGELEVELTMEEARDLYSTLAGLFAPRLAQTIPPGIVIGRSPSVMQPSSYWINSSEDPILEAKRPSL